MRAHLVKSFILKSLVAVLMTLMIASVVHHTQSRGSGDRVSAKRQDLPEKKSHPKGGKRGGAGLKPRPTDSGLNVPTQPPQPVQPSQLVQPPQPSQPPTQPAHPAQPLQPAQPVQPVQPAQPSQPVQPAQPVQPSQPAQPPQPVQPSQPIISAGASPKAVNPASHSGLEINPDVKVIVLSYMRSGSSFTGDIFNHHSKVFYMYEPLLTMYIRYVEKKKEASFFNRAPVAYDPNKIYSLMLELANQSINCEFETMYQPILQSKITRRNSVALQEYGECVGETGSAEDAERCMPLLKKSCASAKAIVAKTVRLSMKMAAEILRDDPKVKVVHLVRDPRGVLQSMQTTGLEDRYHLTSKDFCGKVWQDLQDSVPLKEMYPGRVMTIRYEDLAQTPLDYSARLVRFAGLDFEPALRQYVWNITSSQKEDLKMTNFNSVRPDSSAAASAWRDIISSKTNADICKNCQELFHNLGYLPLNTISDVKNRDLPYYNPDYSKLPTSLWVDK